MSAGLPDLVDCARLAADGATVRRVYELAELPRARGVLADTRGAIRASFAFSILSSGRPGATVTIEAEPELVCQRCMQGFGFRLQSGSRIEFADTAEADATDPDREPVVMQNSHVSLRSMAEEEFLLALPIAPACASPQTCGKAPGLESAWGTLEVGREMRRPFGDLQDLMKKT